MDAKKITEILNKKKKLEIKKQVFNDYILNTETTQDEKAKLAYNVLLYLYDPTAPPPYPELTPLANTLYKQIIKISTDRTTINSINGAKGGARHNNTNAYKGGIPRALLCQGWTEQHRELLLTQFNTLYKKYKDAQQQDYNKTGNYKLSQVCYIMKKKDYEILTEQIDNKLKTNDLIFEGYIEKYIDNLPTIPKIKRYYPRDIATEKMQLLNDTITYKEIIYNANPRFKGDNIF